MVNYTLYLIQSLLFMVNYTLNLGTDTAAHGQLHT